MRRGVRWVAALSVGLCMLQCERTLAQTVPAPDAGAPPPAPAPEPAPQPEPLATPDPQPSAADAAASPELVELDEPAPLAAATESAEQPGLTDIVVTAQRRSTNLQQTPISITALTGDSLRERGANDVSGVTDSTPNVQLVTSSQASGGSNFAQLFIRGVGQTDFYITKDPAVGLYVDGVYLARAPGALLQLLDLERVEVLRGPQGTLFGKNTAGGALSIITKRPDGQMSGVAELQIGNYGRRSVAGSFDVPLVEDRLFLRATALSQHQDGYYERLQAAPIDNRTADGNSLGAHSGRVSMRWAPLHNVDVTLSADGTLQRQTATDYQALSINNSPPNIQLYNQLVLSPRGAMYSDRYVAPRPWTTYSTTPSYNNTDVWGSSGTISWDLGPVQLKSISAYRALRAAARTDADGTPFDIVASDGVVIKQHQISQELQLTGNAFAERFVWVLGLWYFQEKAEDRQSSRQLVGLFEALENAPANSIVPPGGAADLCSGDMAAMCLGGMGNPANARFDLSRNFLRTLRGRSYAAFGQAALKVTDALSFTVGARISREEKTFTFDETRPLRDNMSSFGELKVDPSWNVFTPRLGAEYRFMPALMAYASYAWGFKAGGITGRPMSRELFRAFDPERLVTYELGAKSEWLDHRLRLNVAAFYSQYRDIQITTNTTDMQGMFVRLEQNAGSGTIKGFEAEATLAPIRSLNISAAIGYTDFEFTSLLPQEGPPGMSITLDSQLPYTPKLTAAASASYRIDLGAAGFLTPRADFDYSSGYFVDIPNTQAIAQGRYALINARLAYAPRSLKWEAYLASTNLANAAIIGSGVYGVSNGSQVVSYRPPRMIFAGARFNFD
jgi:iron complex outermembrane recepter protein